jgi:hypothetical protein
VDRRDHGADARGVGRVLDAADDLHGPGAVQFVEDQVDQARAAGGAGGAAALIAALVQQFLDAFARLGGDVRAAVDDARDRRHADAGLVGDGPDRDAPMFVFAQRSSWSFLPNRSADIL